jgi:hypothetical protein
MLLHRLSDETSLSGTVILVFCRKHEKATGEQGHDDSQQQLRDKESQDGCDWSDELDEHPCQCNAQWLAACNQQSRNAIDTTLQVLRD